MLILYDHYCIENDISVVGCDRDKISSYYAQNLQRDFKNNHNVSFKFHNYAFSQLEEKLGEDSFDGMLMDLGTSNMQLRDPERGFSFMKDGPLDMRMSTDLLITAKDVVNQMSEKELADIILRYGEERWADLVARSIIVMRKQKSISTTLELVKAIEYALPSSFRKRKENDLNIHPATKTFQALRIHVNNELEELQNGLVASINLVKPGGMLFVISFHSLEDRIVKQNMQSCPWTLITKKPILPDEEEIKSNRQSRSAKLRIATRNKY